MRKLVLVLCAVLGAAACGDNLRATNADDDNSAIDADEGSDDGDVGDADLGDGAPGDGPVVDASTFDSSLPGDGMLPDGIPSDASTGITCGMTTCNIGQICCVTLGGAACQAAGTCTGQSIACDGPEDCTTAGQVCCASLGGVACSAEAQCVAEVCHVNTDCDQGDECCGPATAPRVCRNVCPGPP